MQTYFSVEMLKIWNNSEIPEHRTKSSVVVESKRRFSTHLKSFLHEIKNIEYPRHNKISRITKILDAIFLKPWKSFICYSSLTSIIQHDEKHLKSWNSIKIEWNIRWWWRKAHIGWNWKSEAEKRRKCGGVERFGVGQWEVIKVDVCCLIFNSPLENKIWWNKLFSSSWGERWDDGKSMSQEVNDDLWNWKY